MRKILAPFANIWSEKLGCIDAVEHRIELKSESRPLRSASDWAGPKVRELEELGIQEQIIANVIEATDSELISPVLLVLKEDGSFRFCIDYRHLHYVTVKNTHSQPQIEECIDSLGTAKIFNMSNANSSYRRIPEKEEDRRKTSFVCHAGLSTYKRMPSGLTNAPVTFQRA